MFGNRTITVTFPNQGNIVISCEGNILYRYIEISKGFHDVSNCQDLFEIFLKFPQQTSTFSLHLLSQNLL